MLYKSVANISQNIDNIPSYLKDDIMALLQQVSRYMLAIICTKREDS